MTKQAENDTPFGRDRPVFGIEISEEMIEAGYKALACHLPDTTDLKEPGEVRRVLVDVFAAMWLGR